MPTTKQAVFATAVPGVSHTEGLCGEVLNDIDDTAQILRSLGKGDFPSERSPLPVDIRWRGAREVQRLEVMVEMALRPPNTGGYYWILVVSIRSETNLVLRKGEFSHQCELMGRHLIVTRAGHKLLAWLLPEKFDLHNPLVRDMIFSDDNEEDHRLVFAHLHSLTSVFWGI